MDASQIEQVFSEAVAIADSAARDRFLDQACASDPALRERVDALLAAHDSSASFLQLSGESDTTAFSYAGTNEGPGTRIGRYKLLEEIGEGGFGVVFMAEQEEPVRRRVALKIIKAGMDTRQVVARFEAERQALAMMDHPHIARVFDAGATENGRPYFVMELVRGIPITEYCDKNLLTIRQRLSLLVQVCQAVQHAHQKGIIHRDLKPSNVLVSNQDDRPVVKVIDFGVAKAIQARLTEKTLFTEFRQLIGTPAYMSPEQAEGGLDVDTRSDVYSLGVLLYELLAGTPPFSPNELRSKAFAEMQRIIREVEPPPPSSRLSTLTDSLPSVAAQRALEPRKLVAAVRGELDWIVMRALEKDRTRRYETASALARDVERYLRDEPVQAVPPSTMYRLRKSIRQHKVALLIAAAFISTLVLGAVASTWQALRATRAEVVANDSRAAAEQAGEIAEQQRKVAQEQRDLALSNLYLSSIPLARENWKSGNLDRMWVTLSTFLPRGDLPDQRGWEWYYLASLLERIDSAISPGIGPIHAVKWSSDGRLLAVAGRQVVKVYDSSTNELVATLTAAWPIAWRPGTIELATMTREGKSTNREVTIWNAETGQPLRRIDGGVGYTSGIAWRQDGQALAWCGQTEWNGVHSVDVWNEGEEWAESHVIESPVDTATTKVENDAQAPSKPDRMHFGGMGGLAWSSDKQKILIATQYDASILIWDCETDSLLDQIRVGGAWGLGGIERNPVDGTYALSTNTGRVILWSMDKLGAIAEIVAHRGRVGVIAWSPDGRRLASTGEDNLVKVWNVATGEQAKQFTGQRRTVNSVDWSPTGNRLAFAGVDGTIQFTGADDHQDALLLPRSAENSIAWHPNGQQIAAPGRGLVRLFDPDTGTHLRDFDPTTFSGLMLLAWSPDGARIGGVYLGDATAVVWDARSGKLLLAIPLANIGLRCFSWSPDSRNFATCGDDGVTVWDAAMGARERSLPPLTATIGSALWSPDGKWFAADDWNHKVRIWNVTDWSVRCELDNEIPPGTQASGTNTIAWSPDSRRLVTRSGKGDIAVWEIANEGRPERIWLAGAHTTTIRSVAWSPDGLRIATGSEDRRVKVWDAATGSEIISFDDHDRIVMAVSWSPDSTRLASAPAGGDHIFIRDARPALNVDWAARTRIAD